MLIVFRAGSCSAANDILKTSLLNDIKGLAEKYVYIPQERY